MQKLLILDLEGTFETGFQAKLEVRTAFQGSSESRTTGELSANLDLLEQYRQWQVRYSSLENMFRALSHSDPEQVTNSSGRQEALRACIEAAQRVEASFNLWLNRCEAFEKIRDRILACGSGYQIWIRTNSVWLQRLVWEKWEVLSSANADVALVVGDYQLRTRNQRQPGSIRILVVFGEATDLQNFPADRVVLETLAQNAGATITWQNAPDPLAFNATLREGHWDMLFFSGHSSSSEDGKRCDIQLTETEILQIPDFRYAIRDAAQQGLRLAIFNSCDGLGLMHQLATSDGIALPNLVFMREKLPDAISPKFLEYFLNSLTAGCPLASSVRQAQEKLHDDWEKDYPCASWLPMVARNPAEPDLTWAQLGDRAPSGSQAQKGLRLKQLLILGGVSLLCSGAVLGGRQLGLLFPLEAAIYDWTMRLEPEASRDDRLLVVTIDQKDMDYQDQQGWKRTEHEPGKKRSLAGEALSKLLKKLEPASVIGLDIQRPIPATDDYQPLAAQIKGSNKLIGICADEGGTNAIPPMPELNLNQVGFSDVSIDSESPRNKHKGKVRRYLYQAKFGNNVACLPSNSIQSSNQETNNCDQAGYASSFALKVTQHFLKKDRLNFNCESLKAGSWQLVTESTEMKDELDQNIGFYRGPIRDERVEGGRQLLLDFRRRSNSPQKAIENIARQESLQTVLSKGIDPDWLKDKIVLIGVTRPGADDFLTPYSHQEEDVIPGVFLHAHAISQLLDILEGKRPVLRFLSNQWELLFVFALAIAGGSIGFKSATVGKLKFYGCGCLVIVCGYGASFYGLGVILPILPGLIAFSASWVGVSGLKK